MCVTFLLITVIALVCTLYSAVPTFCAILGQAKIIFEIQPGDQFCCREAQLVTSEQGGHYA